MEAKEIQFIAQPRQASHPILSTWARRIAFYIVLIALWQVVTSLGIWPNYVLPGPFDVASTLYQGITSGVYIQASLVSLERLVIGYAISLVVGIVLGLLIGRISLLGETFGSLILGLQALPSICWLPIAVLWFGLSEQAIIFVVVMGALFSITLSVEAGVRNTPPIYLNAGRTLGVRGLALSWYVMLPAAMPTILNGFKQGWTFAWRSLMAGELLFFTLSLGNLLAEGGDLNNTSQVLAVMLVIIVIGVAIDTLIFGQLERRVRERWGLQAGR
jgi:NitT/TauT family transport system permease protein